MATRQKVLGPLDAGLFWARAMFGSTTSGKLLVMASCCTMLRGKCHTHTEATLGMDGTINNDSNNNNDNNNNGCMDVNGCDVKRTLWTNPCRRRRRGW